MPTSDRPRQPQKLSFDDLRARNPSFAFAVYALAPGGPVTVEIIGKGKIRKVEAPTFAAAMLILYPKPKREKRVKVDPPPAPVTPVPERSIFD